MALCRAEGFGLCGVGPALPSTTGAELDAWLEAGKHGSMAYLARSAAIRKNALLELPLAKSVVMVGLRYSDGQADGPATSVPRGRIARYARVPDYHDVIKARLTRVTAVLEREHPGAMFRKFTDSSPFMEREHAARAGLGWVGKHTLIIHPVEGSYFVLGGFLTTIEMAFSSVVTDACGTCTRCLDACPTGAITPYSVDGSRCIAYLTIESRALPREDLRAGMGDWIFGCDICQEVCPHNGPRSRSTGTHVQGPGRGAPASIDLLGLLGWTAEDRARELRQTALKRARLDMLKRNAVFALGDWQRKHNDSVVWARLSEIANDAVSAPMVREAAAVVLAQRR
ncbi:MAG: tRNA epoxyqueuosine(34) reductase QueG [Phycisphaerales bacterium]